MQAWQESGGRRERRVERLEPESGGVHEMHQSQEELVCFKHPTIYNLGMNWKVVGGCDALNRGISNKECPRPKSMTRRSRLPLVRYRDYWNNATTIAMTAMMAEMIPVTAMLRESRRSSLSVIALCMA